MRTPERDRELADAYLHLEGALGDLRSMALVMDMVLNGTLFIPAGALEKIVRDRTGLDGYRIIVLTEDQYEGISFVVYQMDTLSRALHREYYRGHEAKGSKPCA